MPELETITIDTLRAERHLANLGERNPAAAPGTRYCGATNPHTRYRCTRPGGHESRLHVAWSPEGDVEPAEILAVWPVTAPAGSINELLERPGARRIRTVGAIVGARWQAADYPRWTEAEDAQQGRQAQLDLDAWLAANDLKSCDWYMGGTVVIVDGEIHGEQVVPSGMGTGLYGEAMPLATIITGPDGEPDELTERVRVPLVVEPADDLVAANLDESLHMAAPRPPRSRS